MKKKHMTNIFLSLTAHPRIQRDHPRLRRLPVPPRARCPAETPLHLRTMIVHTNLIFVVSFVPVPNMAASGVGREREREREVHHHHLTTWQTRRSLWRDELARGYEEATMRRRWWLGRTGERAGPACSVSRSFHCCFIPFFYVAWPGEGQAKARAKGKGQRRTVPVS